MPTALAKAGRHATALAKAGRHATALAPLMLRKEDSAMTSPSTINLLHAMTDTGMKQLWNEGFS